MSVVPMNGSKPVPIIGQPCTVQSLSVCVNVVLECKCTVPATTVVIIASAPTACPACGKVYQVGLAPTPGSNLQIAIAMPESQQGVPS